MASARAWREEEGERGIVGLHFLPPARERRGRHEAISFALLGRGGCSIVDDRFIYEERNLRPRGREQRPATLYGAGYDRGCLRRG